MVISTKGGPPGGRHGTTPGQMRVSVAPGGGRKEGYEDTTRGGRRKEGYEEKTRGEQNLDYEGMVMDPDDLNDGFVMDEQQEAADRLNHSEEVAMLVTAIGTHDKVIGKFIRGKDCLRAISRLQYILQKDDQLHRPIHFELGKLRTLQKMLVPLYNFHSYSENLALCTVKLFTRLTMPIPDECANENAAKALQMKEHLTDYKAALLNGDVLHNLLSSIADALTTAPEDRGERDIDLLQLHLTLFKNILAIKNPNVGGKVHLSHLKGLHDRAILKFYSEGVMNVLTKICEQADKEDLTIVNLLLDIFWNYFRLEEAKALTTAPKEGEGASRLKELMKKEALQKRMNMVRRSRHQNFAGLLKRTMMGGKVVSCAGVSQMSQNMLPNQGMKGRKTIKTKRYEGRAPRTYINDRVRQGVLEVAVDFLESGFKKLMKVVLFELQKMDHVDLERDESQYAINLSTLMLGVQRAKQWMRCTELTKEERQRGWFNAAKVAILIDKDFFAFVHIRIKTLLENKRIRALRSSIRHLPGLVSLYKELIRTLYTQYKYGDENNKYNSNIMIRDMVYNFGNVDIVRLLLRDFELHQYTRHYLIEVVTLTHYMLALVDILTKGEKLVVAKKTKRKARKKKPVERKEPEMSERKESAVNEMEMEMEGLILEPTGPQVIQGMEIGDMNDDEEQMTEINRELEFDMEQFLHQVCTNSTIAKYIYLLKDYRKNNVKINGYIMTMFKRIEKLELEPVFYQVTSFILFQEIMEDRMIARKKEYSSLIKFARNITRNFLTKAKDNPVLFTEALFWKRRDQIIDIMNPAGRNERIRLALDAKASSRAGRKQRRKQPGLDESDEEYSMDFNLASTTVSQWDEKEDEILKQNYVTYKDTGCYLDMLASLLEERCNTRRAKSQIERRLVFLKLKNAERFTEKQQLAIHKRNMTTKPTFDDMLQRRIEASVRGAGSSGPKKDALDWLCAQLTRCARIREDFPRAKQPIAIVPVDREHFQHVKEKSVRQVMTVLNFQPPNLVDGTAFWRMPFVYNVKDMEDAQMFIRDGMVLDAAENPTEEIDLSFLSRDLEEKDEMAIETELFMEPPEMKENVHRRYNQDDEKMDLTGNDPVLSTVPPQVRPETIVNQSTTNVLENIPMNDLEERRKRSFSPDGESSEQREGKKKRRLRVKDDTMNIQEEEEEDDELAFLLAADPPDEDDL